MGFTFPDSLSDVPQFGSCRYLLKQPVLRLFLGARLSPDEKSVLLRSLQRSQALAQILLALFVASIAPAAMAYSSNAVSFRPMTGVRPATVPFIFSW